MDPWVLPRLPVQQQEKRYSRIEAVPISLPPTPDLSFKFPSPKPSATFSTISSTNSPPPKRSCFLPFLDFMSPARQLPLAWTSAVLTFVFLILTAVYSSQLTVASRLRFLYGSSSNTIFILSVLSGLTGIFLAATMAAAFERLQWLLLIRADGLQLSKFLSLQAGTGVPGLLLLTFGKGHPITTSTRLWSAGRLLAITLVPALGILIMSKSAQLLSLHFESKPFLYQDSPALCQHYN